MALNLLIPRLEWNDIQISGTTTSGNDQITGILSTSSVKEGMIIEGVGIPAGTRIVSKTPTSVQLSQDATASGSNTFDLFERYDFQYPPKKDSEGQIKPSQKITTALSGVTQIQTDHIEEERSLEFGFVTSDDADTLREDFYLQWAVYGKAFRYFYDKDDSAFVEYELNTFNYAQNREIKKHPYFLYGIKFSFRRVLA